MEVGFSVSSSSAVCYILRKKGAEVLTGNICPNESSSTADFSFIAITYLVYNVLLSPLK